MVREMTPPVSRGLVMGMDIGARLNEIESALAEYYGAEWAHDIVTGLEKQIYDALMEAAAEGSKHEESAPLTES
jgi:hypothetical protein